MIKWVCKDCKGEPCYLKYKGEVVQEGPYSCPFEPEKDANWRLKKEKIK